MATPSEKTLREVLGLEAADAMILKSALVTADGGSAKNIDRALKLADRMMEAHGVEVIRGEGWHNYYGDAAALYVNTGDTYTGTLLYDVDKDRFYATTYGDWVKSQERSGRYIPNADNEIPIANPDDAEWNDDLYELWFGAVGTQKVYVWSDSFDSALETAIDWLDDEGKCGYFTFLGEEDLRESARDLGIQWPGIRAFSGTIDSPAEKILEHAEMDLMVISHTTLDCERKMKKSAYLKSDEWGGRDVTKRDEYDEVRRRSLSKPVRISYAAYNVFQRYWGGQGDPLYAVLSRRGDSVDWVTVDAMPREIDRLEETADEVVDDPDSTAGERRTAQAMLDQLDQLEE